MESVGTSVDMRILSHELRTPITSILGLADKLKQTDLSLESSEDVENIYEQGKQLLTVIDKLLSNTPLKALFHQEAKKIKSKQDVEPSSPSIHRKTKHLLMAEDQPLIKLLHRRMLEDLGYTVDVADDGLMAINLYNLKKYDAILTDINMPQLSGIEVAAQVRNEEKTRKRIPIIALTADVSSEMREECLSAGIDEIMTKPVDKEQLKILLDQYI